MTGEWGRKRNLSEMARITVKLLLVAAILGTAVKCTAPAPQHIDRPAMNGEAKHRALVALKGE